MSNKQEYAQVGVAMTCRGFDEYMRMFDLNEAQLAQGEVLDIAAGGASFTAELGARGFQVTALDPRYGLPEADAWINEARVEIETSTAKLDALAGQFDWTYYGDIGRHRAGRVASLQKFAEHLASEEGRSRYVAGALPELPFENDRFSLVLCSHFLFLYADQFGPDFHERAVSEMMRVCAPGGTVKIYPLLSLKWEPYPHLPHIMKAASRLGGTPELYRSKLPFIPGSEQGLQIKL
ncbi:class I SAM-dependent methyltransferase [Paenibacillus methanolicus]|uniref:Methyltransferase family protein n=1 Tax=Paenibacillus methanolicus TaxID=582686 RepID=A0A5S5BXS8_9BACL|nr:class I SAM-dependent methyltransferase [Paenibacillus methanolicus]TYP71138.1 methyltransferase family protein [Paenibacillus methanolicus]